MERKIFHITNVENLPSILIDGCLWCDRQVLESSKQKPIVIGYHRIKERRLRKAVPCHPGTMVGDYVPFYFCPRSPMLYVIHAKNLELEYRGGQTRIIHLISHVAKAKEAAGKRPWAFSDGNASTAYTQFSADPQNLDFFVDWNAVEVRNWSGQGIDPAIKHKKQAEFLVHEYFPWTAIEGIWVFSQSVAAEVQSFLTNSDHQPIVQVKREWYY